MGEVVFYPERLNLAILRGFEASLAEVAADANLHSGTPKATAEVVPTGPTSAVVRATGEAGAFLEEGTRPHEIDAGSKGYLYVGNGRFATVVHHPGARALPYIRRAAARWATGGFQKSAAVLVHSSGY